MNIATHRDICDEQWFTDAYLNNILVNSAVQFALYKRMSHDEARIFVIHALVADNNELRKIAMEAIRNTVPTAAQSSHTLGSGT